MPDRGGGREPKNASLRTSKKNPGANTKSTSVTKVAECKGTVTSATPPIPGLGSHFDCGVALLSRLFDRDRPRMLQRARAEAEVAAIVCWSSDVAKQQELADLCKEDPSMCYFATGVHSDNVDKTNKKMHESWLTKTEELALLPECVAVLASLNLNREIATHFAQKSLLESAAALCDKLRLPMVLHLAGDEALEQALGVLRGLGWLDGGGEGSEGDTRRVLLHDALVALNGQVGRIREATAAGMVLGVSAASLVHVEGATDEAAAAVDAMRNSAAAVPLEQLVICSSSPWATPQNLPDAYLRTMRNEPSNIPHVIAALAHARGIDGPEARSQFSATLKQNGLRFFGLDEATLGRAVAPAAPAEVEAAPEGVAAPEEGAVEPKVAAVDKEAPAADGASAARAEVAADGLSDKRLSVAALLVELEIPQYRDAFAAAGIDDERLRAIYQSGADAVEELLIATKLRGGSATKVRRRLTAVPATGKAPTRHEKAAAEARAAEEEARALAETAAAAEKAAGAAEALAKAKASSALSPAEAQLPSQLPSQLPPSRGPKPTVAGRGAAPLTVEEREAQRAARAAARAAAGGAKEEVEVRQRIASQEQTDNGTGAESTANSLPLPAPPPPTPPPTQPTPAPPTPQALYAPTLAEGVDLSAQRVRPVMGEEEEEEEEEEEDEDEDEDVDEEEDEDEDEDNEEEEESNAARIAALTVSSAAAHFSCRICRAFLFLQSDVLSYELNTSSRAVFKEGGEDAPLLLPSTHASWGDDVVAADATTAGREDAQDGAHDGAQYGALSGCQPRLVLPLTIGGTNVVCAKCGAKLGRYGPGDECGGGATAQLLRIARGKVDLVAAATNVVSLIERSRVEAEDFQDGDDEPGARKQGAKKKKKRLVSTKQQREWGMSRDTRPTW